MLSIIFNDIAHPWQIGFQDGASPGFSGIVDLHNTIFFYLVLIAVGVFWLLGATIYAYSGDRSKIVHKYLNHGTLKCLHTKYLRININNSGILHDIVQIRNSNKSNSNIKYMGTLNFSLTTVSLKNITNFSNKYSFNLISLNNVQVRYYSKSLDTFIPGELLTQKETQIENNKIVPVKIYESVQTCKKQILDENKNKSGIYRFYNKLNGNFYIGSSKNLSNRFKSYFNLSYISTVKNELTISRALIKYGYDNFRVEILEYCDNSSNTENSFKKILLSREQYYMDLLKPVYNIEKNSRFFFRKKSI